MSFSYNIVKTRSGELILATKHIEGLSAVALAQAVSEFVIQLTFYIKRFDLFSFSPPAKAGGNSYRQYRKQLLKVIQIGYF